MVNAGFVQFNGAELTPLIDGRVDTVARTTGCHRMQRFTPLLQGGARKTSGTKYIASTKNDGIAFLVPFVFDYQNSYVLEFGEQYIRFYKDRARLGAPYEVSSPYTLADLTAPDGSLRLQIQQIKDVLYLAHPSYAPRTLTRSGDTSWAIAEYAYIGGPFQDLNRTTTTVYASAQTGTVTLTASASVFTSDHVGSLFLLEQQDLSTVKPWAPSVAITANDLRRYDGRTYKALNSATTGNEPPIHETGSAFDGGSGVEWEYQDAGYGIVKITAVASGTSATATVQQTGTGEDARLPAAVVGSGNATTRWAYGAWSAANGYPNTVSTFRERLAWGSGSYIDYSGIGDFESFAVMTAGQVLPENAIRLQVLDAVGSEILWLEPTANGHLVGTLEGELVVTESTTTEVFSANNRRIVPQSDIGSRYVRPVRVGDTVLFADTSGEQLHSINFRYETNSYRPRDATRFSEHITRGGIKQLAFQKKPVPLIWAVRTDGLLLNQIYNEADEVVGWARQPLGGYNDAGNKQPAKVISVASVPYTSGAKHDVYVIVERYINGQTRRYVEYFTDDFRAPQQRATETSAAYTKRLFGSMLDYVYLDSALTYNSPLTITGITKANPAVVTSASHGLSNGDTVRIDAVEGMTDVNAKVFTVAGVTTNTFQLSGVDSSGYDTYVSGGVARKSVTSVSGLSHLEGQEVAVCLDGGVHPNVTVSSGSITLQQRGHVVHVGLPYESILATMGVEVETRKGTVQAKDKRAITVDLRLFESIGGKVGNNGETYATLLYRRELDPINLPPLIFTGDKTSVTMPAGFDKAGRIWVKHDECVPFTILGIFPVYQVNN